jgi:hypothetical protein
MIRKFSNWAGVAYQKFEQWIRSALKVSQEKLLDEHYTPTVLYDTATHQCRLLCALEHDTGLESSGKKMGNSWRPAQWAIPLREVSRSYDGSGQPRKLGWCLDPWLLPRLHVNVAFWKLKSRFGIRTKVLVYQVRKERNADRSFQDDISLPELSKP